MYYDDDGAGLSDRQYYVMDLSAPKDDQVTTRKKSLVGSIFHELTHALHWISKTNCNEKTNIIWKSMEERYTISGYRKKHGHDVICDYGFEKYNSIMPPNPALGRDGKFCPRFGHQRCVLSVNEYLSSCPNNLLNRTNLNIARANNNIVRFIS
jgi:hypothetical protein